MLLPHPQPLLDGVLIERENRFRATVRVGDEVVLAHVPNPGRMHELMVPGCAVQIHPIEAQTRVTVCDVLAVELAGQWVCIDNRRGGRLARLALEAGAVPGLPPYRAVEREVVRGRSRLDFRLTGDGPPTWVEVKSCTLVDDGLAMFPDAPTTRGARHLGELAELVEAGERAAVLFIIQRQDAAGIRPFAERDPDFAEALRTAARAGVTLLAHTSAWQPDGLRLLGQVPVGLE